MTSLSSGGSDHSGVLRHQRGLSGHSQRPTPRTTTVAVAALAAIIPLALAGCADDAPQFSDETSRMESRLSVDLDLRAEEESGVPIGRPGAQEHHVACYTTDGDRFVCEAFLRTSAKSAARGRYRIARATDNGWSGRRVAGDETYFPARLGFPD